MKKVLCVTFLLGASCSGATRLAAESPNLINSEEAAQQYSVGGVGLGLSVADFNSRFPTATKWPIRENVYPKNDVYELTVDNGTDCPPQVLYEFEDGRLKTITIQYSREAIQELEKQKPLLQQLQRRFGDSRLIAKNVPTDFGPADYYGWDFRHLGVEFTYQSFHDRSARFNAYSSVAPPAANPKTSRLGFD